MTLVNQIKVEPDNNGLIELYHLLKPRVMWLAVYTAAVGMFLAPGEANLFFCIVSIICISVGAGAAGALNMWWDQEVDKLMARTSKRPLPSGNISPDDAFVYGMSLSIFSVMFLGLVANWLSAFLLAFTIFFYVVIYSMLLKKRTVQNIVIGGAAGAMPPVIGWLAVTGNFSLEPILLFAVIFFWTPPHFWALSVVMKDDYKRAKIPMFPVVYGIQETRTKIFQYTFLILAFSQLVALSSVGGLFFFIISNILNACLLYLSFKIFRKKSTHDWNLELKFFKFTIMYLFLFFGALVIQKVIGSNEVQSFYWLI